MNFSAGSRARVIALRRRLHLLFGKEFDPFPPQPEGLSLNPSDQIFSAYNQAPLALSRRHSPKSNPTDWQVIARQKIGDISGYDRPRPSPRADRRDKSNLTDGLQREQLYLRAEQGLDIPVNVISSENSTEAAPVMICLQGTNSGAHLSWDEARMPADPLKIANGSDFALQAVRHGYRAVCIEQCCFGERREHNITDPSPCTTAANHAYLMGRSLIGERARDVSFVIDWLRDEATSEVPEIYVMGSSSGGSTAIYAAALDQRIAGVLASGCVGPIRATIGR